MTSAWLSAALDESRRRGFLGPGAVEPHIEHSQGFIDAWRSVRDSDPGQFLDLGSGGGIPALVILEQSSWPGILLDSMRKRANFLREVLGWDGAPSTGQVVLGRAEDEANRPAMRESFELVVARSFGPPSVVAECASGFLSPNGVLIVSEPPEATSPATRWRSEPLAALGLSAFTRIAGAATYQVLVKTGPTPPGYPRRNGMPMKRPLF